MNENISAEQYQAEINALHQRLDSTRDMIMESAYKDPYNPFENPTEYRHYNGNYSEILPEVKEAFVKIPLNPRYLERYNLKKLYNITGIQILFLMLSSNLLIHFASFVIISILQFINPEAPYSHITDYYYCTSIIPVNLIVFMICNLSASFFGLKWSKISPASLFKTQKFNTLTAISYFFIAFLIQQFTLYLTTFSEDIINSFGFNMYDPNDYMNFHTPLAKVSEFIYTVMIAPVTEELFYRGFVLKNLSKANQRFGIFMTAFLFGIMHSTVPQFILGFVMGIFLSHITIKHNSIIPAILVHVFNNTLFYILTPLQNIKSIEIMVIVSVIYMVVLLLGIFFTFSFISKNKLPSSTPHQARRGFSIMITSIPMLISIVLYLYETITRIQMVS